ncbi:PQQ-binding-like beta-propeller repeat protein [uncultured Aquimarina sp.]|uniref:outer membrane protein assembly factor BamB family protein n=1 Tax=uncultured Aquimarina sp. TaxID=575652 RepID=UPI0026107F91|nr:PQQ-binding-like beta-propeller repeat protein [uncultured Aquimarina sp.]
MKLKSILYFLLFVLCYSCSSDDNYVPPVNSVPGNLKIEDISFVGKQVTIDWNDIEDADGDIIFYSLYIDSVLISESTESIVTRELEYNNSYNGRIIATDRKGGVSEISFDFESPKSKILFFRGIGGKLTAFDLITNEILWAVNSSNQGNYAHTVCENKIFNGVSGLDLLSGEVVFSFEKEGYYRNIITDENNIYADEINKVHCFDKNTGDLKWERSFSNIYAPLSIDKKNVFVCSRNNDYLYAINKIDGELNWSFDLDFNPTGSAPRIETNPLIVDNNIYFGDTIGRFYSVDINTGNKNWSINAGLFNSFSGSPILHDESVIVATVYGLYSYDKNTGSQNWSFNTGEYFGTSPYVYMNNVYAISSINGVGNLVSVNAGNGNENWRFVLDNRSVSSPIVYEGNIYFDDFENLYCLNAQTGELIWKKEAFVGLSSPPIIVIGNGEEVVYPSIHGLKN